MPGPIKLKSLADRYGLCRLGPNEAVPGWAQYGEFQSITRTPEELSILCPEENIPAELQCERGWVALKLGGPFEFTEIGILSGILAPLAQAGISILAVSTFDTDYVLIKEKKLTAAREALKDTRYQFVDDPVK